MMQSCFPHVSKMSTFTFNRANNVIIKNAIILNIIHNVCNLHRSCHIDIISCSINESQHYLNITWYKRPSVVYQHGQSHIWGGARGGTGSDVTGSCRDRKWRHRKSRERKYVLRMSGFSPVLFPRIFLNRNV